MERELYYKRRKREIRARDHVRGFDNYDLQIVKLKIAAGTDSGILPIRQRRAFRAISSEEFQRLLEASP